RRDLAVSVRSGGHGPLGRATNVGGMVVDLGHLDGVDVLDADRRLVRVGAGATWGRVASLLDPHGWGITSGDTTDVGVGGLTLGGGVGWMVRKHGLTVDNLVGARVVTADGLLLTASEDEHPDLFWALRGGGGNFGVVVDLDFVAQEVTTVHHGSVAYAADGPDTAAELAGLVRGWRDAMRSAPDELSSTFVLPPRMPGAPAAMVLLCYAGRPGAAVTEADAAIEPLLELGTVAEASIRERRYAEVLEQAQRPPGMRPAVRNALVPALDDDVVSAIVRAHQNPAPNAVAVRGLGGAFGRVPVDATAFAHRDAEAMVVGMVLLPETASEAEVDDALVPWRSVAAHGTGAYVGFQGSAAPEDLAAAYPPATYARLAAVKRSYDPANVFALNHNVPPAG
ncbi:MAG TPA: FAD-binding protein, partial [Nocardioides sp.]|nr:FAD-binding protein [Nocardioides sp.]